MTTERPLRIGILGATGVVGRRICEALDRLITARQASVALTLFGRDQARLVRLASLLSNATCEVVVDLRDAEALALALAPLTLLINAAGPFASTGVAVARAAIAAGVHYCDVASEQQHVRSIVERLDALARRAHVAVVPSVGVTAALTDWACDVLGANAHGSVDQISTTYVYDNWHMSAGSQRALFGSLGMAAARWQRDRWLPARFGERSMLCNVGLEFGGPRTAVWHPSPDIILLSRRLQAQHIDAFVSPNRSNNVATLLRGAGLAMSLLPMRSMASVLGPFAPDDADFSQGRFAVATDITQGGVTHRSTLVGQDLYQTTATIAAHVALHMCTRQPASGVLSPAQVWDARDALEAIMPACGLQSIPQP